MQLVSYDVKNWCVQLQQRIAMSEKNQYSTDLPPSYEVSSGFSQNAYAPPGSVQAGYAPPGSVQAGYTSVGYSSGHVTAPHTSFPACSPGVGMTHQPGGPLPEAYQKVAQCWFITAIVTCIFFFPLGIPAAIFCHKAKKAAERGDNFEYLKYLKIGRTLAGAGIGLSMAAIINLSVQLPLRL
ncbi:hypothetical protein EB796_011760 [Bugula neritina]|uniref:PRRT1 n=1 Tax=Bugula neritina TaxID=10212 RepID=A0A7J7JU71_BUGNE|nr:hypothetical protein EB796_011760 [Bugula neritina]